MMKWKFPGIRCNVIKKIFPPPVGYKATRDLFIRIITVLIGGSGAGVCRHTGGIHIDNELLEQHKPSQCFLMRMVATSWGMHRNVTILLFHLSLSPLWEEEPKRLAHPNSPGIFPVSMDLSVK